MYVCMYVSMYVCMYGWMDGWMEGWILLSCSEWFFCPIFGVHDQPMTLAWVIQSLSGKGKGLG